MPVLILLRVLSLVCIGDAPALAAVDVALSGTYQHSEAKARAARSYGPVFDAAEVLLKRALELPASAATDKLREDGGGFFLDLTEVPPAFPVHCHNAARQADLFHGDLPLIPIFSLSPGNEAWDLWPKAAQDPAVRKFEDAAAAQAAMEALALAAAGALVEHAPSQCGMSVDPDPLAVEFVWSERFTKTVSREPFTGSECSWAKARAACRDFMAPLAARFEADGIRRSLRAAATLVDDAPSKRPGL